jgi:hypothetical protein
MGARRSAGRRSGAGAPPILPRPKRWRTRRGELRLADDTPILVPSAPGAPDRRLLLAAQQTRRAIRERCGIDLAIERPDTSQVPVPAIACRLDPSAALVPDAETARDAYRLAIGRRGVEVTAPAVEGLRHGLQTLVQLVSRRGVVPALEIVDQPDLRDRGIMLDVSRGKVPTLATLEALVDLCSRLRLNVLMLYVEHTFAFRRHPEIGHDASPLDAATLLALDAYAADRGVELVPCLQSLGHMERVLEIDRYAHLAESERRWSVSPSEPETYALLGDLYDEFLPLFASSRFNANCDEPFDLGRGRSRTLRPGKGPARLFVDHVAKLRRLARSHGKRLMIWADFALKHPEMIDALPRDVVLLDWWYEAEFDASRIERLRGEGFEVWVCPGTSSWNCLFPRVENSLENITRWAHAGRRHDATGMLNTDWGDFGHYNALGVSLHAYAWGAQQAWSGDTDAAGFDRAFAREVFGEQTPRLARLYRRLGAIHDAGFRTANGSPLQYLYFDPLGRSFFLKHAKRRALERSRGRIERVLDDVARQGLREAGDDFAGLARREVAWAADATRLAIDKGLAAVEYDAWRTGAAGDGSPWRATERRALARRLDVLADEQGEQLDRLEALWLARSAVSDLARVRRRVKRSIASLRDAARRLRRDEAPRPPKDGPLGPLDVYDEVRRAMGMRPR